MYSRMPSKNSNLIRFFRLQCFFVLVLLAHHEFHQKNKRLFFILFCFITTTSEENFSQSYACVGIILLQCCFALSDNIQMGILCTLFETIHTFGVKR